VVGAAGLTLGGGLSFLSAEHVSGEDICLLSSTISLTHLSGYGRGQRCRISGCDGRRRTHPCQQGPEQ
jgi:hypothetical protein